MKKIFAALLLTGVAAGAANANMTGFYAGIGGVAGATTANWSDRLANPQIPATVAALSGQPAVDGVLIPLSGKAGKSMFGGRIEAGYGMTFARCGWFGASVYGTWTDTKLDLHKGLNGPTVNTRTANIRLENKYNYGISLKIGYHFTRDTVGYVGVAAEATKWKLPYTQEKSGQAGQFITSRSSKTNVGVKPLIGVRTTGIAGNRNLYLDMQYGYGIFKAIKHTPVAGSFAQASGQVPIPGGGGATTPFAGGRTVSAKPRTHEVSLTIGWRF